LVCGITALLQKKIERYTELGAVCYPHQTPTKKLRKSSGGPSIFGGGSCRPHQWLRPCPNLRSQRRDTQKKFSILFPRDVISCFSACSFADSVRISIGGRYNSHTQHHRKQTARLKLRPVLFSFTNNFSFSFRFIFSYTTSNFCHSVTVPTIKKSLHNTENRTCRPTIWKCFSVNYEDNISCNISSVLQTTSSSWQQVKNCLVHLQEYKALQCSCGSVSLPG